MRCLLVMFAIVVTSALTSHHPLAAQAVPLAFDAASIKENKSVSDEGFIQTRGRFTVTNSPVVSMITYAYRVRDYQVIDAPGWTSTTPYDVVATYPQRATPSDEQVRQMVQGLLADRFGLQVHRETRELPAFELRMARRDGSFGPRLTPSTTDCTQPPAAGGFPPCQGFQTRSFIQGRGQTLDGLAAALQAMVRQRVVNRTNLDGAYDLSVRWGDSRGPAEQATVEDIAAMMTALQEQLGLRLDSSRVPEEVVVVDAVRRPTAN